MTTQEARVEAYRLLMDLVLEADDLYIGIRRVDDRKLVNDAMDGLLADLMILIQTEQVGGETPQETGYDQPEEVS